MTDSASVLTAEIRMLERKQEEDPEGRYFVQLADKYRLLGEYEHAERLLRGGLQHNPEFMSAHIVLGQCLLDRGDTAGAVREFRHVLSVDPQNLVALRTLGELAAREERWEEARQWLRELLAVDPLDQEARGALDSLPRPAPAQAPGEEPGQESEPAAPLVEEAEEEWAESEVVTETIAELYARQGVYDRAAEVYRELVRRGGAPPQQLRRLQELERLAARAAEPAPEQEPTAAAAPAGPTIAAYLAQLLAWRSVDAVADAVEADLWREAVPASGGVASPVAGRQYPAEDQADSPGAQFQGAAEGPAGLRSGTS